MARIDTRSSDGGSRTHATVITDELDNMLMQRAIAAPPMIARQRDVISSAFATVRTTELLADTPPSLAA